MTPGHAPDYGHCRACPARIRWIVNDNGNRQPLDADPHPDGTIAIDADDMHRGHQLTAVQLAILRARAEPPELFMPHHATCPNRRRFQR
jgi:hypothetical protein